LKLPHHIHLFLLPEKHYRKDDIIHKKDKTDNLMIIFLAQEEEKRNEVKT
jgi:hypothetical protein